MGEAVDRHARRAQLVVLAQRAAIDAPESRRAEVARPAWRERLGASPAARELAHLVAGVHELIELGTRPSYLVLDGVPATRARHRSRIPAPTARIVALEPVRVGRGLRLFVAPPAEGGIRVNGVEPLVCALLAPGDVLTLGPGLEVGFTTYRPPALIDVAASDAPRRCALCRGRLVAGVRAVRCTCGALVHAGFTPPFVSPEPPHRCAELGDCPDCGAELPREFGHEWLPPTPWKPDGALTRHTKPARRLPGDHGLGALFAAHSAELDARGAGLREEASK